MEHQWKRVLSSLTFLYRLPHWVRQSLLISLYRSLHIGRSKPRTPNIFTYFRIYLLNNTYVGFPIFNFVILVPMLELVVDHPVGKSFPANPDSFEDAVAGQLMHDQGGVEDSRHFVRVGHDASGRQWLSIFFEWNFKFREILSEWGYFYLNGFFYMSSHLKLHRKLICHYPGSKTSRI